MKKNCMCCVLLFVLLFSIVVYAGYATGLGEDGAGRTVKYVLTTTFNRIPLMADYAKAQTINTTENPALLDVRCYVTLFAYNEGKTCKSSVNISSLDFVITTLSVNCDEFGGQGMLMHRSEWRSLATTSMLYLDY